METLAPHQTTRDDRLETVVWKATLILLAGLFIYSPVFHGGWLWDDNFELTENAVIQDPHGLTAIWQGHGGADFLPLKSTLQWTFWHIFGADPAPFHLVSIVLHLLNALLLWRLLHRLGMTHGWLGGLLLAVHPIFVESVAWPSELKNTMSLAALLLTMLAWVHYDDRRRKRDYALALVWFVAALLCKSSVVMWPVVILLHAWWKRGRIAWGDALASLPFFTVSLAAGITTYLLQTQRAIGAETFPLGGAMSRLALAGLNLALYARNFLWPVGLVPMYTRWHVNPPTVAQFLPWLGLIPLAGWLWTRRRTPWARCTLFGLGFFVVNAAPVLGFFQMSFMRIAWASDHLVYLPCVGFVGLAAAGLGAAYDRLDAWKRSSAVVAGWLCLALTIFASYQYAGTYSSLESMCRRTIRYNPDAWLAHQLYSVTLIHQNDIDAAFTEATAAVTLKPDVVETQNTIANALELKGDVAGAVEHLQEAARLAPHVLAVRINLSRCLARSGRYQDALTQYESLLQQMPGNAVFLCNAGVCLFKLGRVDDAVARFREALSIDPGIKDARDNLDTALKQQRTSASGNPSPDASP